MKKEDAQTAVKVMGVVSLVFGALALLVGAFMSVMMAGVMPHMFDAGVSWPVPVFGIASFFVLAISALYFVAGFGVLSYKSWAPTLMLVASALSLFSFPIGTAFGAVGIWLFGFEDEVRALFS